MSTLEGHATSCPLGIKAICTVLNARGYQMRGKPFYTAAIENIIESETYAGTAYFTYRWRAELSPTIPALQERLRNGPVAISDERIEIFSSRVRKRIRRSDGSGCICSSMKS